MKLDGKTNEELHALRRVIESKPENHNPPGSLCIYTPKASKKLSEIAWAITHNMTQARKAAGTYVEPGGYSGRKSNRRR